MSKFTENLIFLGTDDFSATVLEALVSAGYQIGCVITRPDRKRGRGQKITPPAVKVVAEEAGLKIFQPSNITEVANDLTQARWAVLASYGQIIPGAILDKISGGIINIHPSLLPLYRGPSPIEHAILNGDRESGVSLMKLTAAMDAGPVYAQEKVKISIKVNRLELSKMLAEKGAEVLLSNLDNIVNGQIKPSEQDSSKATYTKLLAKEDGLVDWSKPAQQIEREVRAYLGWPKSRAKLKHYDVILTKTRAASSLADGVVVHPCGEGWLEIQELIAPSGRTMTGANFLRGYLLNK